MIVNVLDYLNFEPKFVIITVLLQVMFLFFCIPFLICAFVRDLRASVLQYWYKSSFMIHRHFVLCGYCSQVFVSGNLTLKREGGQAWWSFERTDTFSSNDCGSMTGLATVTVSEEVPPSKICYHYFSHYNPVYVVIFMTFFKW